VLRQTIEEVCNDTRDDPAFIKHLSATARAFHHRLQAVSTLEDAKSKVADSESEYQYSSYGIETTPSIKYVMRCLHGLKI
jgi:hypothetical protein